MLLEKKLNILNFDTVFETPTSPNKHVLTKWFQRVILFVRSNALNYTQDIIFKHFKNQNGTNSWLCGV